MKEQIQSSKPSDPMGQSALRPSVLTSSSTLTITELLRTLAPFPDCQIDLFVFRDIDRLDAGLLPPSALGRDIVSVLETPDIESKVAMWLQTAISNSKRNPIVPLVGALATYFPEITIYNKHSKQASVDAAIRSLEQCVRIALKLKDEELSDSAVVEMVCGSRIDFCRCSACSKLANASTAGVGHVFTSSAKIESLLDSLLEVERRISADRELADREWALALEFEPGESYVLGNIAAVQSFADAIKDTKYERLRSHVGLNIDIGHMRIAGIETSDLIEREVGDIIVHSHISDNPGMHTRDLPTGMWNAVNDCYGFDFKYLRWLSKIDVNLSRRKSKLPFSRSVALELEGCDRPDWVNSGVASLRYMLSRCGTIS